MLELASHGGQLSGNEDNVNKDRLAMPLKREWCNAEVEVFFAGRASVFAVFSVSIIFFFPLILIGGGLYA